MAKAIRDGVVDGIIDYDGAFLQSNVRIHDLVVFCVRFTDPMKMLHTGDV